jgi:hypothetical protein
MQPSKTLKRRPKTRCDSRNETAQAAEGRDLGPGARRELVAGVRGLPP